MRWFSGPDSGVYDAMNKGVEQARGRWLIFLGAGDRLRPGVLARVAPLLPRNTLAFVYGNAFMCDKGIVWDGPWTPEKFRTRNICHQAIFYGRALFPLVGRFDTRFRVLADYEMNMRCFAEKRARKIFIDEVIADYEGGGMSATVRDEPFYEARPALLQKYFGSPQRSRELRPNTLESLRANPKTWLVTGCAGFIGSHLLEALLQPRAAGRGARQFFHRLAAQSRGCAGARARRRMVALQPAHRRSGTTSALCREASNGVDSSCTRPASSRCRSPSKTRSHATRRTWTAR